MGRAILGNYAPGDSAITLFAGVSARPAGFHGYGAGFGATPDVCDATCYSSGLTLAECAKGPAYIACKAENAGKPPGGGTDWAAIGRQGASLVSGLVSTWQRGQQQQQPGAGYGVAGGYGAAGFYPPAAPSTPSWLLPVGIGAGVLVLGALALSLSSPSR